MPEIEIIAFHGWGFDSTVWNGWKDVSDENTNFLLFERGYFGKAKHTPIFTSSNAAKVIFTHSFGLHQCPVNLFKEADLVVIFNGFIDFHPIAAQYRRRSKIIVKQMLNALQGHPEKVLKEFYKNTFKPNQPVGLPDGEPEQDLLIKDLRVLNSQTLDITVLKSVNNICILHGFEDAILHRRKGRTLYDNFSKHGKYFEVKKAGHALPFTHRDQCRQFIEPEIKKLVS